jgi:hypothetical protein
MAASGGALGSALTIYCAGARSAEGGMEGAKDDEMNSRLADTGQCQ